MMLQEVSTCEVFAATKMLVGDVRHRCAIERLGWKRLDFGLAFEPKWASSER